VDPTPAASDADLYRRPPLPDFAASLRLFDELANVTREITDRTVSGHHPGGHPTKVDGLDADGV
jgi:hypothetical protein